MTPQEAEKILRDKFDETESADLDEDEISFSSSLRRAIAFTCGAPLLHTLFLR